MPPPIDMRQYLIGFLKPLSSSISRTWPTTTPVMSWPTCSTDSTSRPAAVSRLATSAATASDSPAADRLMPGSLSAGSSAAYSSSQDSGTRITPPFRMRG